MPEELHYFAPCPKGLEPLLAEELRALRLRGVRPQRAGVLFRGRQVDGLRAILWSRVASRVLMRLDVVDASSAETLRAAVEALPWEDHLRATGTLAVDAVGVNAALRNTQFTAVTVKDGVVDRMRARFGRRPSVDVGEPDLRINVAIREAKATISLDIAGEALHRRGFRPGGGVAAPIKENLAAALLLFAGWPEIAKEGGAFLDPCAGSGTIPIEAALIAADIAPGLLGGRPGVERWLGADIDAWRGLLEKAEARREAGLAAMSSAIAGGDSDMRAIDAARSSVRRAGLEDVVAIEHLYASDAAPPEGATAGLVACNPPYGERIGDRSGIDRLYATMSAALAERFEGWSVATVSPDPALLRALGYSQRRSLETANGRIPVTFRLFDVEPGAARTPKPSHGTRTAKVDAEPFGNRLRKMSRHFGKWARRADVSCYRVYDADLPDFNVAIDVYEGAAEDEGRRWISMAEYAPPAEIDPEVARARLESAVEVVPEILGVESGDVFVRRRERQRGSAQYEPSVRKDATGIVAEGGLLFEVNLSDYLDTGLFLDHRITRGMVRDMAEGKRFLNLFAYTGTASVYAADGGAISTTTVDLSATYLAWAERNLTRNGFEGESHQIVRDDVLAWVTAARKARARFDLVFCDPPTFSNSKRMDSTWDVQRDHAALLAEVAELLADDGRIVFSCNRRGFALGEDALASAGLSALDITARTIPPDFERHPGIHQAWIIEPSRAR